MLEAGGCFSNPSLSLNVSHSFVLDLIIENQLFLFGVDGPVIVVVVVDSALSICSILRTRCVGRNQPSLCSTLDVPSSEGIGPVSAYDGAGAKPSRHMTVWNSGRKVAMHPAVIPIPGSTVDHIDTSIILSES